MAHVAESTHWYDREGRPCYTITGKNGKERPTTLRDARVNGWLPSVTAIIKCAAAPGLERWKLDQMLHAALTLPRASEEPEKQWIERVWVDSRETAKKAAERGTAVHAAIQGHFGGEEYFGFEEFAPHVDAAAHAVNRHFDCPPWISEMSFAHPLGFGGKADLYAADGACGGNGIVCDFKTKEFAEGDYLKTWDEHAQQLAAYRVGLGMPSARCAICYVSVTNPGLAKLIEIPEDELQRGWDMFKALLAFWMAKTGYVSEFAEKVAA